MNYIKTFYVAPEDLERVLNPFLEELYEKKHRVMGTRFYFFNPYQIQGVNGGSAVPLRVWAVITVNDSPHPHSKGNETKE